MNDDDFRAEYDRMRREFEKLSPNERSSSIWPTKPFGVDKVKELAWVASVTGKVGLGAATSVHRRPA